MGVESGFGMGGIGDNIGSVWFGEAGLCESWRL